MGEFLSFRLFLQEPAPSVYFKGFGDSTLESELLCWTQQMLSRRRAFVSEMNHAIWEELTARGMDSAKTSDARKEKQP